MQTSTSSERPELTHIPTSETAFASVLSLDAIEALRDKQRRAYQTARYTNEGFIDTSAESEVTGAERAHAVTDEYITEYFGTDVADSRYQTAKDLLETYSYVNVPDQYWYVASGTADDTGNTLSGMDKFIRDRTPLMTSNYETEADEAWLVHEADAKKELLGAELDELRHTLSSLTAKRQGHIAGQGGEAYAKAHTAYMAQVIALGRVENAATINDESLTEQAKQVKVIEYIFAEQTKLREQTTEKLKGTKVGKFVAWMNRGNIATRVVKGLAIGIGVGGAAAVIGGLAGVAGVASLGAGVGAVGLGAWRFARGFARADNRGGRGMASTTNLADHTFDNLTPQRDDLDELLNDTHASAEPHAIDYVEVIARRFGDVFENDTKLEQHKRLKSVIWGLGGIAVGAAIAGGAHFLLDLHTPDTITKPHTPSIGGRYGTMGTPWLAPTIEAPIAPELDTNFNIQSGEGGIHFFQRLGLTGTNWYNIQNDLLNRFPHDFYDPDGTGPIAVRIAHPGQLSIEAQTYIKQNFGL